MSNIERMTPDEQFETKMNVVRGYGELVEFAWTDVEVVKETQAKRKNAIQAGDAEDDTIYLPVKKVNKYYIGKMNLFQTSGIISILGAIFVNGADFKEKSGRTDNITFLEMIDEFNLGVLTSLVYEEDLDFLRRHWNPAQVIKAFKVFFKYNDFFGLLKEVGVMGADMGVTEEQARKLGLGQASLLG